MKSRNIYRDILIILLGVVLLQKCWQKAVDINEEINTYEYMITAPDVLTEDKIKDLEKLGGVQDFYPVFSLQSTLKLEGYSMDITIKGVNTKSYPLTLYSVKGNLFLGSIPSLFVSSDCLEQFVDINGHGAGKKKIAQWKKEYQQLSLEVETALDAEIKKEKAEIAGILKGKKSDIIMDQSQLKVLAGKWGKSSEISQGYLFIKGKENAKQAASILEAAGFAVEKR